MFVVMGLVGFAGPSLRPDSTEGSHPLALLSFVFVRRSFLVSETLFLHVKGVRPGPPAFSPHGLATTPFSSAYAQLLIHRCLPIPHFSCDLVGNESS